ncbi:hypothetical protein D9M69_543360 [compost metagenome]
MLAQITEQIGLELIVATAQSRTQQLHTLCQHLGQIQLGLAAAHQTDQHPAAILRQQLEVQGRVIAAHRIENHIERPQIPQTLQIAITHHAALGAQRFAVRQSLCGADADPARVTEGFAQLNGS